MGVYLCVDDAQPDEWTFGLSGDRQLAARLCDLPRTFKSSDEWEGDFRPADFDAWRAAEVVYEEPDNPGRFRQLIDLLEANPDYWVSISW